MPAGVAFASGRANYLKPGQCSNEHTISFHSIIGSYWLVCSLHIGGFGLFHPDALQLAAGLLFLRFLPNLVDISMSS